MIFQGCGESDDTSLTVDKEVDDLECAIEFVKNKNIKHVGLIGLSLGGLVSIRNCDKVDAMILWAPVTNKKKDYRKTLFSIHDTVEENGLIFRYKEKVHRKKIEIDEQMIKDRESVNQRELLSKINYPILIIHGNKDDRIPLENSKNAMKYLPKGSRLEIIEGADHSFENHVDKIIEISLNWFREHLK